jgi:hypothetical protein
MAVSESMLGMEVKLAGDLMKDRSVRVKRIEPASQSWPR